jgi:hypothetical protein
MPYLPPSAAPALSTSRFTRQKNYPPMPDLPPPPPVSKNFGAHVERMFPTRLPVQGPDIHGSVVLGMG